MKKLIKRLTLRHLKMYIMLLFSLLSLSIGCSMKIGARFNEQNIDLIEPGKTDKIQLKEIIGRPASIGLKDGNTLWTYIYAEVPIIGSKSEGTILSVEFNKEGKVKTYTYIPY